MSAQSIPPPSDSAAHVVGVPRIVRRDLTTADMPPDTAGQAPRAWLQRFVRLLLEARESRGLTQEELGKRTGLKATAISHFEGGRRTPCIGNLIKLCQALKVSADHLLGLAQAEDIYAATATPSMTTMDSPLPETAAEAADSQPATDGPMGLAAVPCSPIASLAAALLDSGNVMVIGDGCSTRSRDLWILTDIIGRHLEPKKPTTINDHA